MSYSLGSGSTDEFVSREFCDLDLRDKRLAARIKNIVNVLQNRLGSCIRRLFTDTKDARQAYDFFSNPKISSDKLISTHYAQTAERIRVSRSKYILAIQDQMYLNYTNHKAKNYLGTIGKTGKTVQYGIIQHSCLCVDDSNEAMGLLDLNYFDNSDFDTSKNRHKRPIEDKASLMWILSLKNMRQRLGHVNQRIITVADREGDFYEFLYPLMKNNEEFVIRAQHNRSLGEKYCKSGNLKLYDMIEEAPVKGRMEITFQDTTTREIKEEILLLKGITVDIFPPKNLTREQKDKHKYEFLRVNVVVAYNDNHKWILLTNLPVKTVLHLEEVVNIYKNRWHVEDYHKVLKTGYQVDEIYLHSSKDAIKTLLTLAAICACRLYWMIYIGRTEANVKANILFEEFEWKAIYVYFNEPLPKECPTISEVVLKIARLGGYKHSKHSNPPGIKTMWIGYQQFSIAAQTYRNMLAKTLY